MPENYTIQELVRNIKAIDNKIVEGFRGVHSRQDITNGKVSANRQWIDQHDDLMESLKQERNNKLKRYGDLVFKMTAGGALIIYIIQYLGSME